MATVLDLYNIAFGYRGLPFATPTPGATPADVIEGIKKKSYQSPGAGKSPADVISSIAYDSPTRTTSTIADGLNHKGLNGVYYFMPMAIGGVQLPNEPTMSVTSKKNIVETKLVGMTRRGTVKELISEGDYEIRINGICMSDDGFNYPSDQVEAIRKLYDTNESLKLTCALADYLEIENIVIRSIEWVEMKGISHCQGYKINAVSDEDFILIKD